MGAAVARKQAKRGGVLRNQARVEAQPVVLQGAEAEMFQCPEHGSSITLDATYRTAIFGQEDAEKAAISPLACKSLAREGDGIEGLPPAVVRIDEIVVHVEGIGHREDLAIQVLQEDLARSEPACGYGTSFPPPEYAEMLRGDAIFDLLSGLFGTHAEIVLEVRDGEFLAFEFVPALPIPREGQMDHLEAAVDLEMIQGPPQRAGSTLFAQES